MTTSSHRRSSYPQSHFSLCRDKDSCIRCWCMDKQFDHAQKVDEPIWLLCPRHLIVGFGEAGSRILYACPGGATKSKVALNAHPQSSSFKSPFEFSWELDFTAKILPWSVSFSSAFFLSSDIISLQEKSKRGKFERVWIVCRIENPYSVLRYFFHLTW